MDIDDITAQSFIFFIAGFINVALTISFAGYELAIQPEIQDKLRKEIREHLQKNNGKLDYDSLKKMKYLDMVVTGKLQNFKFQQVFIQYFILQRFYENIRQLVCWIEFVPKLIQLKQILNQLT